MRHKCDNGCESEEEEQEEKEEEEQEEEQVEEEGVEGRIKRKETGAAYIDIVLHTHMHNVSTVLHLISIEFPRDKYCVHVHLYTVICCVYESAGCAVLSESPRSCLSMAGPVLLQDCCIHQPSPPSN